MCLAHKNYKCMTSTLTRCYTFSVLALALSSDRLCLARCCVEVCLRAMHVRFGVCVCLRFSHIHTFYKHKWMTKLALEYTQTCECLKDFRGDFFALLSVLYALNTICTHICINSIEKRNIKWNAKRKIDEIVSIGFFNFFSSKWNSMTLSTIKQIGFATLHVPHSKWNELIAL